MKKLTKVLVTSAILLMATVATKAADPTTVGLFVENEQARIFRFQIESGTGIVYYFAIDIDGVPFHFNSELVYNFYLFSLPGLEYTLIGARTTDGENCLIDSNHQVINLGCPVQVNLDIPSHFCQSDEKIDLNEHFTCTVPYQRKWYEGDGVIEGHFFDPSLAGPGNKSVSVYVVYRDQEYSHTAYIEVWDMPELEIRGIPSSVIYNTTDPFVVWGLPSGGILKIDGCLTNTFNPNSLEIGDHRISYEYRAPNGCSDIITKIVHIYKWTSLEEVCEDVKINIYPNPVSCILTIEAQEAIGPIQIYNLLGSLVYSQEVCLNIMQINVSWLPSGVYFVRSALFNEKFIKL